jgi:hypothetical protein
VRASTGGISAVTTVLAMRLFPASVAGVLVATACLIAAPAGAGEPPPVGEEEFSAAADSTVINSDGYWLITDDGEVFNLGGVVSFGQARTAPGDTVDLEPIPSASGYWVLARSGEVKPFGAAPALGNVSLATLVGGEQVASISSTPTGLGYWVFTNRGRAITFGDARSFGDLLSIPLNGPIVDSIPTPTGLGYYMVGSDGGIFAFGDARFAGSMGGQPLNSPVVGITPDPDGTGYWLVGGDGGVFAFQAGFRGSMGGRALNRPVVGMVPYGNGYLLVGEDGGVFSFSDLPFQGSLGGNPPGRPVRAIAVEPGTRVGTGDVRVTITWTNRNDIDLYVTDPSLERIWYADRQSPSGGFLDVDANANCGTTTDRPVENVFWPTGGSPSGSYRIEIDYYRQCTGQPLSTPVRVQIVSAGVTLFDSTITLTAQEQTIDVFSFTR